MTQKKQNSPLKGKTVLVTAGPTQEFIDPVRFLSNASSGKMGYALAEEAQALGAGVILVSGPVEETLKKHFLRSKKKGSRLVEIRSAEDMYHACLDYFEETDLLIMCAAVADYTPWPLSKHKIKKNEPHPTLLLKRTRDILTTLGKQKNPGQVLVGFAAETQSLEKNARKKIVAKNLDALIANKIDKKNPVFGKSLNEVVLFIRNGNKITRLFFPLQKKHILAKRLFQELIRQFF